MVNTHYMRGLDLRSALPNTRDLWQLAMACRLVMMSTTSHMPLIVLRISLLLTRSGSVRGVRCVS